jgi:hypothetical protein
MNAILLCAFDFLRVIPLVAVPAGARNRAGSPPPPFL